MADRFETISVNFNEESGIGAITLDRPGKLNALSPTLLHELVAGLEWLEDQQDTANDVRLRAVIITGSDGNFSAGADIDEFEASSPGGSSEQHYRDYIIDFPVPTIAKIQGYCLGGGFETALACDFRFAQRDSQFGLPEVNLGIIPGGGIQFVSRLSNPSIAKELAMTGKRISPERALQLNLINHVSDDAEKLDEATRSFAETIASKPPLAIQAVKNSANLATEVGLDEGRKYDREQSDQLRHTEDFEKATRAFADEEYEPDYKGR